MTPEQIEFHRKRFEEVFAAKGTGHNFDVCDLGRYRSSFVWHCWQGYLMAIESIEIPIREGIGIYNNRYILNKDDVEHLKSLGLKVKER